MINFKEYLSSPVGGCWWIVCHISQLFCWILLSLDLKSPLDHRVSDSEAMARLLLFLVHVLFFLMKNHEIHTYAINLSENISFISILYLVYYSQILRLFLCSRLKFKLISKWICLSILDKVQLQWVTAFRKQLSMPSPWNIFILYIYLNDTMTLTV